MKLISIYLLILFYVKDYLEQDDSNDGLFDFVIHRVSVTLLQILSPIQIHLKSLQIVMSVFREIISIFH